ncbi:MAG: glycosyltransferase family 39 protein [Deltaproteobacteria bacterium]|nr:glycosyltransferase family 39 protein [Deltaproteobacteria bacterium]
MVLSALALRLMGLSKGIWLDEWLSIRTSGSADLMGALRSYDHPPLYFVLLRAWSILGSDEKWLRLLSVIFGLGTVVVMMAWTKGYSRTGSLVCGALCATMPMMLRFSQEIRHYSVLLFFASLSYLFADRVISSQGKKSAVVFLSIWLSLCVLSHSLGITVLVSVLGYMLLRGAVGSRAKYGRSILMVVALPLIVFFCTNFLFKESFMKDPKSFWVPGFTIDHLMNTILRTLGWESVMQLKTQTAMVWPGPAGAGYAALVGALGLTAVFACALGRWKKSSPMLLAALLHLGGLIVVSIWILPTIIFRTLLPALVPFAAFSAVQVSTIPYKYIRWFCVAALLAVACLFAANWVKFDAARPYEEWSRVSVMLNEAMAAKDALILYPNYVEGPLGYYLDISRHPTLSVGLSQRPGDVAAFLSERALRAGGKDVMFMVVRYDALVQKNSVHYEKMLDVVKERYIQESADRYGVIRVFKYARKNQ